MSEIFAPGSIAGATGATGATGAAGPPANFAGVWASGTAYTAGQAVSYTPNGNSYVALASTTGNEPDTSPTYWGLLAAMNGITSQGLTTFNTALAVPFNNLFNYAAMQTNYTTASNGTLAYEAPGTVGGGPPIASGLIFCPGAVGLISNSRLATAGFGADGAYFQLFDANGNYIGNATDPGGYEVEPSTVVTLPGTQAYVRVTFASGSEWQGANTMICAGASPTLPGSFVPFGLDTVADVNTKDATVAANAATALTAAMQGVGTGLDLFARTMLPLPQGLNARNAFDWTRLVLNTVTNPDGTLSTSAGTDCITMFCPGATSFITNACIPGAASSRGFQLLDASGNFIEDIATTTLSADWSGPNGALLAGTVYPLPGTQTYVRVTVQRDYASYGFSADEQSSIFIAGNTTYPCPTMLPASLPCNGGSLAAIKSGTQLGGDPAAQNDSTAALNAFLATASSTNPIELVLDGNFLTTGLVLSTNGYTTIRGLGAGTGITLVAGSVQDGIRIGAYTAGIGNSEGTLGATPPARSTRSIILRDFQLIPNGQLNAAANQPVTGAAAHGTYGVILANATDITIDNVTVASACANYCITLSNVDHVNVRNCNLTTTGTLHDGIHIDGPSEKIHIEGCTIATGDDGIALNAYEGYSGDITDVTIANCVFVNALTLMRAYGSVAADSTNLRKVARVAVSNCTGTVLSCVASLGLSAGGCNNSNVDEIRDITFSNCDITHGQVGVTYGPFLLCCNVRNLSINNHVHRPLTAVTMIQGYGANAVDVTVNGLMIVRGDDAYAAPAVVDINASGGNFQKLTLRGITVVDETGSSYTALPYVVGAATALGELVIDSVDMDKFTALLDSNGTTNIASIKGAGVLGTGASLPDSVMANNSLYLSSTDSGVVSLKVSGTAKRLTPA